VLGGEEAVRQSHYSPEEPACQDCGFDPCRCALIEERDEHARAFALDNETLDIFDEELPWDTH
jgi:hypothetical protein